MNAGFMSSSSWTHPLELRWLWRLFFCPCMGRGKALETPPWFNLQTIFWSTSLAPLTVTLVDSEVLVMHPTCIAQKHSVIGKSCAVSLTSDSFSDSSSPLTPSSTKELKSQLYPSNTSACQTESLDLWDPTLMTYYLLPFPQYRTYSSKCSMIIWDTVSLTRRHLVQSFRVQAARLPRWVAAATRPNKHKQVSPWAPWQQPALLLLPYFSPLVEANLQSPDHIETCCQLAKSPTVEGLTKLQLEGCFMGWHKRNHCRYWRLFVKERWESTFKGLQVGSNVCNAQALCFYPSMNPLWKVCSCMCHRHTPYQIESAFQAIQLNHPGFWPLTNQTHFVSFSGGFTTPRRCFEGAPCW